MVKVNVKVEGLRSNLAQTFNLQFADFQLVLDHDFQRFGEDFEFEFADIVAKPGKDFSIDMDVEGAVGF